MLSAVSVAVTARSVFVVFEPTYVLLRMSNLDVDWAQTPTDPGTVLSIQLLNMSGWFP